MPQTTTTADRPHVPTPAEIEQRRAKLHRLAGRHQPKPLVRPSEPEIDPLRAEQSPHAPPSPQFPQPTPRFVVRRAVCRRETASLSRQRLVLAFSIRNSLDRVQQPRRTFELITGCGIRVVSSEYQAQPESFDGEIV